MGFICNKDIKIYKGVQAINIWLVINTNTICYNSHFKCKSNSMLHHNSCMNILTYPPSRNDGYN